MRISLKHFVVVFSLLAVGCVKDEGVDDPPMCVTSEECDTANGEFCMDGTCFGNPPDVDFAAVLVPPASSDPNAPVLVRTEIPLISIAQNGEISGLQFGTYVTVSGSIVLACNSTFPEVLCGEDNPIAATVKIERASLFEGGPNFRRELITDTMVLAGEPTFSLKLPPSSGNGLDDYIVTITPEPSTPRDESANGYPSAAELAPPKRFTLRADSDQINLVWEIGNSNELRVIGGRVVNSVGTGMEGLTVRVFGRWSPGGELELASSESTSDASGGFTVRVPIGMQSGFDIEFSPGLDGDNRPTLRAIGEVFAEQVTLVAEPYTYPSFLNPDMFIVPVRAPASGGGLEPISGAKLTFRTELDVSAASQNDPSRVMQAYYEVTADTDDIDNVGDAVVPLIPGGATANRTYSVRVVAPTNSPFASAFEIEFGVGPASGATEAIVLARRVAVSGKLFSFQGEPIANASIEVRASNTFKWNLDDPLTRSLIESLPLPTVTSVEDGSLFVWLDDALFGNTADYDFSISPPNNSGAPQWTFIDQTIGGPESFQLADFVLPDASHAFGVILDQNGSPVVGAELHLYQLPSGQECNSVLPGFVCKPAAQRRGIWQSDVDGRVTPVLPDP